MSSAKKTPRSRLASTPISAPRHLEGRPAVLRCRETDLDALAGRRYRCRFFRLTHLGAAREKVRVARAIEGLPEVSEALRLGKLSYSKARAITRIATPENERFLVGVALGGTTRHLERLVRYARKYGPEAAAARAAQQHRDRYERTRLRSPRRPDPGARLARASTGRRVRAWRRRVGLLRF